MMNPKGHIGLAYGHGGFELRGNLRESGPLRKTSHGSKTIEALRVKELR